MQAFNVDEYEYKDFLPTFPKVDYEPHKELKIVDKAFSADPSMKSLLSAATKVENLTAGLGTRLSGIDLRQLSDQQKNDMALLAAQRGVLVFDNQAIDIYGLLDIARYYGPLHVHSTTGVPTDRALEGVHVVWSDGTKKPDWTAMDRGVQWHSDQTYEINTPGLTSLKIITAPSAGGDTLWCNAAALYSTFSPGFQAYLETLSALHSSDIQEKQAIARGTYIRRPQTDCIHPVVRVHPVTGLKSLYINQGYTRRIVGVPQAESDAILAFLFSQIKSAADLQVRVHWGKDTVCMWDNRFVWHTATFDYFPEKRHGLRATPVAERPMSVAEYEKSTGKKAKDWYKERMASFGVPLEGDTNTFKPAGAD